MICPKCKTQFMDQVNECTFCKVKLSVTKKEPNTEIVYTDLVEIMTSANLADLNVIKSYLESNDIKSYIYHENFLPIAMPKLFVSRDDEKKAKKIIKSFEKR